MALFGEKNGEKKADTKSITGGMLSNDDEIRLQTTLKKLSENPEALFALLDVGQWVLETKFSKEFPCEHRTLYETNAKGKVIEAAEPMYINCDADAGGKRKHIWTDCLDCKVGKTSLTDQKNVVQAMLSAGVGDPHSCDDKEKDERQSPEDSKAKGILGKAKEDAKANVKKESGLGDNDDYAEYMEFKAWKAKQQE